MSEKNFKLKLFQSTILSMSLILVYNRDITFALDIIADCFSMAGLIKVFTHDHNFK